MALPKPLSVWIALTVTAMLSCGDAATAPDPIVSVVVLPGSDSLYVGDSRTFAAVAVTQGGDSLRDRPTTWTSSNEATATVSAAGEVTAAGVGTARIRATIEGHADSAMVVVRPNPVAAVSVNPPSDTIGAGWTLALSATLRDSDGQILTGRAISWTATSAAVNVSTSGLVTGVAPGTALLIASSEGVADTAFLEVMDCAGTPTAPWFGARNRFTVPIGPGLIQRSGSPLAAAGFFRTTTSFGVPNPTPVLYGGGVMYGTASSDLVLAYDFSGALPSDVTDGPVCVLAASGEVDHTFADVRPEPGIGPLGLEVRQETYAWSASADTGYILVRYTFTNIGLEAVSQLYVGFGVDWDPGWGNPATDDVLRWNAGLAVAEAAVKGQRHDDADPRGGPHRRDRRDRGGRLARRRGSDPRRALWSACRWPHPGHGGTGGHPCGECRGAFHRGSGRATRGVFRAGGRGEPGRIQ
jgi:hypothetical protein